ncbi:MAG: serine--tRNA ligase [Clostridium sp.]
MLDIKRIRMNPDEVREGMLRRKKEAEAKSIDVILELDERRRAILVEVEALKSQRNTASGEIAKLKKAGESADHIMAEMKELSDKIKGLDESLAGIEEEQYNLVLRLPNVPNPSVPAGEDDTENIEMRKDGTPREFDFEPLAHWDIGTNLDILDFERAGKVTGARFTFYKGAGARLERALINFFLDKHTTENGYTEILPPFMANSKSLTGTGQLPKFEEDMFKLNGTDYYLIPTAEVPVTNIYRDEVLPGETLPILHTAYSPCFRAEAGSAGRDTRGLIRQHQFNKVELVKFASAETSYDELEKLTNDAESVLKALGLPYRVVKLCTGDLGFSSAMTYDIEVWMPSYGRYVEISSCSNFEDFQGRRANIRYKENPKDKPKIVHTLNGSGVAVGRALSAIFENYQNADGTVTVPEALRPYMGGLEVISGK